ncbi:MAG: hypothetical protein WC536_04390 [Patescibacteria group bacterium]|jgi:FtsZ-interacting cell division protein ZipA
MENSNPNVTANSTPNTNQPQNVPVQAPSAPEINTGIPVQTSAPQQSEPSVQPTSEVRQNTQEQPQAAEPSIPTGVASTKSSKLKMIVIVAAAIVLLVGGYFVYQYLVSNNSSDDTIEFIEE